MIVVWMFVVLIVLILLAMPVFGAMGIAAFLHYLDTGREGTLTILFQQIFRGLTGTSFMAIPMFLLAGQIMSAGGLIDRLLDLAKALLGHLTGGLAQVNIGASVFFSSISGSAHADVAALGTTLIPAMEREGYPRGFAGALTAASGTLTPLLPPSIVLIVYGAAFGVSIGALFAAGAGVGLLLALMLSVQTYFMVRKGNYPRSRRQSGREILRCLLRALPALGLPAIILGGIFGGIFTATEASAVAVAYALTLIVIYGTLPIRKLPELMRQTALTTAAIMILIAMAQSFSYVIARRNVPEAVMGMLGSITDNYIILLMLIVGILVCAGMFVDRTTNVLLFGPILLPILHGPELGFGPVHAAMTMIMALGVGHLTPPVGGTLLTTALVGRIPVEELTRYMWPYIISFIILAMAVTFVPAVSETLPRILGF